MSADDPGPTSVDSAGLALERGQALGRYVILEQVGAGSMGVVYGAYDPRLDRRVALKIMREAAPGSRSPGEDQRFLREARAMARLAHPNVVTVFDAGVLDGRAFVAMEYVPGVTLRRWLAERKRSASEVLAMFAQAGRGLAAAHAAGLVHRDFKPDNVLVDASGRARVTDFGLARAVGVVPEPPGAEPGAGGDPAADPQPGGTELSALIGTPAYMAPEQITGRRADRASDLFSFCVALYEALYGMLPFEGRTAAAVAFAITMGRLREPPRLHRVPARIAPILERGLALRPEDRPASMDALLADLGRDPARRLRRWIAGSSAVLMLVGGAAWVGALAGRPDSPGAVACGDAARQRAAAWNGDRRRAVETALLATGHPIAAEAAQTVPAALERSAAAWEEMRADACAAALERNVQSERQLALRLRCLQGRLAELSDVVDLLTRADARIVEGAAAAVQTMRGVEACGDIERLEEMVDLPSDPGTRAAVAETRSDVARAQAHLDLGRYAEGMSIADRAVARARQLAYPPALAEALYVRALLEGRFGTSRTAEGMLYEAITAAEAGRDDLERARAWTKLVWEVGRAQGHHEQGHRLATLAEAVVGRLEPEAGAPLRAELQRYRGTLLREQGRFAEAVAAHRTALALTQRVAAPDDRLAAGALNNLAVSLDENGDWDEAIDKYQRAGELLERLVGANHPDVGIVAANLCTLLNQKGRYQEAQASCERALRIRERVYGGDSPKRIAFLGALGEVLLNRGRVEEAIAIHLRAIALQEAADAGNVDLVYFLNSLGWARRAHGEVRLAMAPFRRGLELAERLVGKDHILVAENLSGLAACALDRGAFEEAIRLHGRALEIRERARPGRPDTAVELVGLGRALRAARRTAEALAPLQRALEIRTTFPVGPGRRAEARFLLARTLWDLGRDPEWALELALAARAEWLAAEGDHRRDLADIQRWLGGRPAKAVPDAAHGAPGTDSSPGALR